MASFLWVSEWSEADSCVTYHRIIEWFGLEGTL